MIEVPYVEISTARLIRERIELARATGENVAITGAAGVGKTWALENYVASTRKAYFFSVSAALGKSAGALFGLICEEIGYSKEVSPAATLRWIRSHFHNYCYDHQAVLIFDEAQNIKLATLRDLLTITDERQSGVTIVFSGNEHVLKVVNAAKHGFEQIGRRIQFRLNVNCITHEDADLVAGAFGVTDKASLRMLREIGDGAHIAGVVTVLKLAHQLAGEGSAIETSHIRSAIELFPQYQSTLCGA
ncbi:AAA family ATPase [Rhodoplanes azumiensis]|uniref:AAA family ATPase n=1 Tax=Rhodoplanes azumiensis TaxID=1897628 RepID=A0ABW5ANB1_9BRAD